MDRIIILTIYSAMVCMAFILENINRLTAVLADVDVMDASPILTAYNVWPGSEATYRNPDHRPKSQHLTCQHTRAGTV